jgi:hypothetical protein
MAKLEFNFYLHDDNETEQLEEALIAAGAPDAVALVEQMGKPFYEVTLRCEVDTETGNVRLIKATL